jgi:tRNA (cmo5U34)-methyltransferase
VLIPYTLEENRRLLKENGFSTVDVFFKWYNWAGVIAVKKILSRPRLRPCRL